MFNTFIRFSDQFIKNKPIYEKQIKRKEYVLQFLSCFKLEKNASWDY